MMDEKEGNIKGGQYICTGKFSLLKA